MPATRTMTARPSGSSRTSGCRRSSPPSVSASQSVARSRSRSSRSPRSQSSPRSSCAASRSSTSIGRLCLSIVELPSRLEPEDEGRAVAPEDWARYERYVAEIFSAFGMDLDTPGTHETPGRFLQAVYDATAGYEGDPKLRTAFPSERPEGVAGTHSQIVEGPISFFSLCEHHAL